MGRNATPPPCRSTKFRAGTELPCAAVGLSRASRSFSAVIKKLDGDFARTICFFSPVLHGLDTIEDDMTIPDDVKQPILHAFHEHTVTPCWNYTVCGPDEKDRQLLIEYAAIVEEVNRLSPGYKEVILDICRKMELGMADYAHKFKAITTGFIYLATVAEYDLYCHYVADLVGVGFSGIFSASAKEAPWLCDQLELSNSMDLLQKTNIIRDRMSTRSTSFGPASSGAKPERVQLLCANIAIATLELCFMNLAVFDWNIKIRKAEAARLIMRSTKPREVAIIFTEYARRIHAKAAPSDPNIMRLSVACGKIEQWREHRYPSFVYISTSSPGGVQQMLDLNDPRTTIVLNEQRLDAALARKRCLEDLRNGIKSNGTTSQALSTSSYRELASHVGIAAFLIRFERHHRLGHPKVLWGGVIVITS